MKLERILDHLNSFEKNSFLKIIDNILNNPHENAKEIELILTDSSRDLKNMDNLNIVNVFSLLEKEFIEHIKNEFLNTTSQLDILTDIISKDGNCIMKQDWFARLYEKELKLLNDKIGSFQTSFENGKSGTSDSRIRDYRIYKTCLETSYFNDDLNNQDRKITTDEQSILNTLANQLGLSQKEVKLINYFIVPVEKHPVELVRDKLKSIGVIFYSKKTNTIFVADEVVRLLRKVSEQEIADKFFKRVLRTLKETQINLICKQHNIDWRKSLDDKIREIIVEGVSFTGVLANDIFKEGITITDKKKFINELCDKRLKISPQIKGATLNDKIKNLIKHFEDIERDDRVSISIDGYEKLLLDLGEVLPMLNKKLKTEFEFQEEHVTKSSYLLDYNIKPQDVLEIFTYDELGIFCDSKEISKRGNLISNILDAYKDAENLYLENYENIGFRNQSALKENGLVIKDSEIGIKFEDITKKILEQLGFNVDEKLRKNINTSKDKIDIIINLGKNELILIECKTVKESSYNKFSSVSRQLRSYATLAMKNNYKVIKSLLIAPDFSDDFIKDCGLEYELNLSLITAASLIKILKGFRDSKLKILPYNLLMRDVLIQEERVLKAISR